MRTHCENTNYIFNISNTAAAAECTQTSISKLTLAAYTNDVHVDYDDADDDGNGDIVLSVHSHVFGCAKPFQFICEISGVTLRVRAQIHPALN